MGLVVSSQKDKCVLLNKFQAVSTLFSNGDAKHEDKMNLFFVDFDFVPLLVHENYLSTLSSLDDLSLAADSIAFSDTVNTHIKEQNDWSLLPIFGQAAAIAPASYAKIPLESVQFTEILGRGSAERKAQRLRYEVRDAIGPLTHLSEQEAVEDYLDLLTRKIVSALTARQKDAVPEILELMETYQLSIDLVKNNCLELCSHAIKTEFKALPQTLRALLTKTYTKRHKLTAVDKEETRKTRDSDSGEDEEDANIM
jgi:replication factor C subunit 1